MPSHQKAGLVLIMALGLLTMVMSIMRTVWIVHFFGSHSNIYNYDENAILTLALLEGDMVIMLGCIPTLRNLLNYKLSAKLLLHKISSKWKSVTGQQLEASAADQPAGITGAYLDLELGTRGLGVRTQSGTVRVYTTHSHSNNISEDYLVEQRQTRQ